MTSADFKDHFSTASADYQRYRPGYPAELFSYLADLAPANELAWDCATGTGQAACSLAAHFRQVIASDASAQQIARARPVSNIAYRVGTAEQVVLEANSIDLITVAQALHWFEQMAFYKNAWRCLKARGVLAVWSYNLARIEPGIDAIIDTYYHDVVGPYWPPERKLIEQGYPPIPGPFKTIETERFAMQASWTLAELTGYLGTWSASQYYLQQKHADPRDVIHAALHAAWQDPTERKTIRWPLQLQVGIKT